MSNSPMMAEKESWVRTLGFSNTIDGRAALGGVPFVVINPATGLPLIEVMGSVRSHLDSAMEAAVGAFKHWRLTSWDERRIYLREFAAAMLECEDDLASLLTLEQGRPLAFTLGEVRRNADFIRQLTELTVEAQSVRDDEKSGAVVHYRPLGVVAAIAPWNVPITMAVGKLVHSLYTGNTLVLKPSPYTPLATLKLGEIGRDIFPSGVFNVVAGGNELGQWMSEHPLAAKVTFTGSGATGRRVLKSASESFKRVTLELGGNDAALVLDDVDIDAVAPSIFGACFANSGQICMAIKRLYVQDGVYDRLVERLISYANTVRMGDGFSRDAQMGPVQNAAQFGIVNDFAASVIADGGQFVTGGRAMDRPGYFFPPTIALGLLEGSRLVDGEPFGPILPIMRFTSEADAIVRANSSPYGLGASVWSQDADRAAKTALELDAGTVWINDHIALDPLVPFGGVKASGLGRESGVLGLQNFMEPVCIVTARTPGTSWFQPPLET